MRHMLIWLYGAVHGNRKNLRGNNVDMKMMSDLHSQLISLC